jgi:HKD family nuclease
MAKSTKTFTTFVTNDDVDSVNSENWFPHETRIIRELASAKEFVCLTAYASYSGFKGILKAIKARLGDDPAFEGARFYIGLDFYRTDPEMLKSLLNLISRRKYGNRVAAFVSAKYPPDVFFHPKVYLFGQNDGSVKAIIGSANLTQGGLKNNYEVSALIENNNPEFTNSIEDFILQLTINDEEETTDGAYLIPLTKDLITDYEKKHAIYKAHMQLAERKIKRIAREIHNIEAANMGPHLETLQDLLREMKTDNGESGFEASIRRRKAARAGAIVQLRLIRDEPGHLSSSRLLELYDPLIAGTSPFWKSGYLYRGKTIIANQARDFQHALQQFDTYYHLHEKDDSIENIYQQLFTLLEPIRRAGTNVLTEILHTYDNARFPVMNQNSVAGIGLAGFRTFPTKPSKTTLTANRYAAFCAAADRVRIDLKLKNYSELDTLFNYAYWNYDEYEDEEDE